MNKTYIVPTDKPPDVLSTDNNIIKIITKMFHNIHINDSTPESAHIINNFTTIDISHLSNKINSKHYFNSFTQIPHTLISENSKNRILIKININAQQFTCLFDTGAEISVLGSNSEEIWKQVEQTPELRKINLRTAGGEIHKGQGVKLIPIEYDGETNLAEFVYAPSINIPITLGMNFYNLWKIRLVRQKANEIFQHCHNEIEIDVKESKDIQEIEHTLSQQQHVTFTEAMSKFNFSDGDKIGCQKIINAQN